MSISYKTKTIKVRIITCDICGKNDFMNSIESCIVEGCIKDMCVKHSEYYGGSCVYINEEGMYCPEHSQGKKSKTKLDE
jgi:hypothetical protein